MQNVQSLKDTMNRISKILEKPVFSKKRPNEKRKED